MASIATTLPRQRDYWSVSITHFFVDLLNSGRNLIVALLALSLGLSNAQVGLTLIVYNVGNALSQPLFGWLADRIGPRWLIIGGLSWMMCFSAVTALATDWIALIAITLVGLGSGAFHPSGTKVATQVKTDHRNQATAVFFVFGQTGLFLGPILAGALLAVWERPGYLAVPALATLALILSWQWVHNDAIDYSLPADPSHKALKENESGIAWWPLMQLGAVILGYSTVGQALAIYTPVLFTELGYDLVYVGWLSGIAMMGGVVGGITGGALADRFHGRIVIFWALALAGIPLYFAIPAQGITQMALLALAGFLSGMPHSILVIAIQNILPGRKAFASGLALGFMFFSGSIGGYFIGLLADQTSLATALQWMAVLPIIAALCIWFIPAERIAPTQI